jgi:hypothetical protein
MSSVTVAQRSPDLLSPFKQRQRFFLFTWLDSAWFPWVWMALWGGAQVGHTLVSWHFFATGAELLSSKESGAGLHLYATHPQLQIGPLAFLAAVPLNGTESSRLCLEFSGATSAAQTRRGPGPASTGPTLFRKVLFSALGTCSWWRCSGRSPFPPLPGCAGPRRGQGQALPVTFGQP